jgi:hypothetical protein
MRYFGPFEILARVGEVTYKLKLPEHARIHPVFHVSQLKLFRGNPQDQYMPLPLTMNDTGPIIQPSHILQARTILKRSHKVHQVLVQWEQQPTEEATWEDIVSLQQKFPSFNLEDKVDFKEEGIVMKARGGNILEGQYRKEMHMWDQEKCMRERNWLLTNRIVWARAQGLVAGHARPIRCTRTF